MPAALPDDLAALLAAGRRAAFHGAPSDGVGPLRTAASLADDQGRLAESAQARWLLAVVLAAAGRYGGALAALEPVRDPVRFDAPRTAGLAAATTASVQRQLGRHAVARDYDRLGLAVAGGGREVTFDCRLGLAADAVGLNEPATAVAELAAARAAAEAPAHWRQAVRLDWVRAEVALLLRRPDDAIDAAGAAAARARAAAAPRHLAKSLLFLGAAELEAGGGRAAAGSLHEAARLAEQLGALPLTWPARALLARACDDDDERRRERSLAVAAIEAIARDLPAALRTEWLARPDVASLRPSL